MHPPSCAANSATVAQRTMDLQYLEDLLHLSDLVLLISLDLLTEFERRTVLPVVDFFLSHGERTLVMGEHQLQEPPVKIDAGEPFECDHGFLLAHPVHVHAVVSIQDRRST